MTPTPLHRPHTIAVSKRVHWALKIISSALRGDGPLTPELTSDGVANTMLEGVIERNYPELLGKFRQREKFDVDAVGLVKEKHKP